MTHRGAPLPNPPALLALLIAVGCADSSSDRLSYDRCDPGDTCGLSTSCVTVSVTTTGAPATLCSLICVADGDCPGAAGRCLSTGGASGRCLRACTVDAECGVGTVCRGVQQASVVLRYCLPDTGVRRCMVDADCSPLAARCRNAVCVE